MPQHSPTPRSGPAPVPGYLRRHWRGEQSLGLSFWVNFLTLAGLVQWLGTALQARLAQPDWATLKLTMAVFALYWLVVYPWQLLGVLRAGERAVADHRHAVLGRLAPLAVLVALAFLPGHLLGVGHGLHALLATPATPSPSQRPRSYALALSGDGVHLHVQGSLDFGITRDVRALAEAHPQLRAIVLDSGGGPVFEARMLGNIIRRHALDTYSLSGCSSACTIAFASGTRRWLAAGARLGFHRYRLAAHNVHPFLDIEAEQQVDLDYLAARGIDARFLAQIFATPPERLWFPASATLVQAGVIDAELAPEQASALRERLRDARPVPSLSTLPDGDAATATAQYPPGR